MHLVLSRVSDGLEMSMCSLDFSPSNRKSVIWISSPSFWNSQFWLR